MSLFPRCCVWLFFLSFLVRCFFLGLVFAVCLLVNFRCMKSLQQYQRGIKTRTVFRVYGARFWGGVSSEPVRSLSLMLRCQPAVSGQHRGSTLHTFHSCQREHFFCFSSHQSCHKLLLLSIFLSLPVSSHILSLSSGNKCIFI